MSLPKAEVIYELNTEQFVPAANTATNALNQIKDKTKDAAKEVEQLERKASQAKARVAASFTGMATNAAALAFSFRDLGDAQIKIDSLALKVKKAQEDLNKSMKDGSVSAQDLANKKENLRILEEKHKDAMEDAEKAQVQFMFSMGTMATVTIPSTIAAITQMRAAHAAAAAAAATHGIAQAGFTASLVATTRAIWGKTLAMLANPLFAIPTAAAIGTAIGLVATNTWGLRDALLGSTEAVVRNTAAVGGVRQETDLGSESLVRYTSSVQSLGVATGSTTAELEKLMGVTLKSSELSFGFDKVHESILGISAALRGIDQGTPFENLTKSTELLFQFLNGVKLTTEEQKINYLLMKDQIIPTLENLGTAWSKTGKTGEEKFLKMLKDLQKEGKLSTKELKELTEAIKGVNSALDDSKKKLDPRKVAQDQEELAQALGFKNRFEMQAVFGFNARGISNEQAGLLSGISAQVQSVFRAFRPFGDSLDTALGASLRNAQGISQRQAANLVNAGRGGGSTASRSGSGKARSGGFGGNKDPFTSMPFDLALARAMGLQISSASSGTTAALQGIASRQINSMLQLIQEEGFSVPTITGMQTQSRVNAALASVQSLYAIASKKRADRIAQQQAQAAAAGISFSEFLTLSQTTQGQIDIQGMTLFRQLASYGG